MNKLEPFVRYYLDLPDGYLDYKSYYEELLECENGIKYPAVVCLGELKHMSGHYVVATLTSGKVVTGLHPEIFKEVEE